MEFVEPIRNLEKIELMKDHLRQQSERNYMLFRLGINTGLRVSDLLNLKVKDLRGQQHIRIRSQKTGKPVTIPINGEMQKEIRNYIEGKDDEEYFFKSRHGANQPISRQMAYIILNRAAGTKKIRLKRIGCHSMRKTFGYWHYQKHKDLSLLQEIFNHSTPEITRRYIGINQDEIDKSMKEFEL